MTTKVVVGGASVDSCAGVHDGLDGSTELSAWRPAPRLNLQATDDDAMITTGMTLERPRSDSRTSDGLGNGGRKRTVVPRRTVRAGAGTRRSARVGADALRVRGRVDGVAVHGCRARVDSDGKQEGDDESDDAGREAATDSTLAKSGWAATLASGFPSTTARSAGFQQPTRPTDVDRGAAGPPRFATAG